MWPFPRKENPVHASLVQWVTGRAVWTPKNYQSLAREAYEGNVYAYQCVNLIARACAGIGWSLYRKRAGKRTVVEEHPVLTLLNRPNPQMGGARFCEAVVAFLYLAGNSYVDGVGPEGKPFKELYPLRPDRMQLVPSGDPFRPIDHYEYKVSGNPTKLDAEKVLHMKTFHPTNDWYGLSPIGIMAGAVDQSNAASEWNLALLQNSARPSGVVRYDSRMGDEEYEQAKKRFISEVTGAQVAGRPMFTTGDFTWEQMGLSPQDMEWLESKKLTAREIAIGFGVSPELIGDSANKTHANYGEARKALYEETVLPLMDWLVSELDGFLLPRYGDQYTLGYDKDDIEALNEDRDRVWRRAGAAYVRQTISREEAREEMGLPRDPAAGDTFYAGPGTVPAEDEKTMKALAPGDSGKRAEAWKAVERSREEWYPKVRKIVRAQLEKDVKDAAKAVRKLTIAQAAFDVVDRLMLDRKADWMDLLSAVYLTVGEGFYNRTVADLEAESKGVGGWALAAADYLRDVGGAKITAITGTTLHQIRGVLERGIDLGESIDDLARDIDLLVDSIIPYRGEVIARTEVIGASNAASHSGARDLAKLHGYGMVHEWLATPDERTRDWHLSADRQKQPIDRPYEIDGESLMFPGDSSLGASGRNTIQCRCVETFEVT